MRPVFAVGPERPYGVLIAESPGGEEVAQGEPLVGPTGRELNRVLLDAGLVRERLLLINAVACKPVEPKTEADMRRAVVACQPLFWAQLVRVAAETPTLVCGKWAHFAAFGVEKGVMKRRGFVNKKSALRPP